MLTIKNIKLFLTQFTIFYVTSLVGWIKFLKNTNLHRSTLNVLYPFLGLLVKNDQVQFSSKNTYDSDIKVKYSLIKIYIKNMIRLSALLGANPLRYHTPKQYLQSSSYLYSVGQTGEVVAWRTHREKEEESQEKEENISDNKITGMQPIYQLMPSIIADTDQLIDIIVSPLRLINNEIIEKKIITIHQDSRIRIWTAEDGLCINISEHGLFQQNQKPLVGLIHNEHFESRFFLAHNEKIIFIVDSWTMKIVERIQPKIAEYSRLQKCRINEKKQLEMMDRQNKMYKMNIETLFDQVHLDVGGWISNLSKAQKFLQNMIEGLRKQKIISSYKKINFPDINEQTKMISQYLDSVRKSNIWAQIFDEQYHSNQIIAQIINTFPQEYPTVSNCFFIKNHKLWYFFGTNKGRLFGIPVVANPAQLVIVLNQLEQYSDDNTSPVAFMNYFDNLLVVSWQNGKFCVYTIDNLDYTVKMKVLQREKQLNIQRNSNQQIINLNNNNLIIEKQQSIGCLKINLNSNRIFNQIISSEIKYRLQIFSTHKGKYGSHTLAFQLLNNQILMFDTIHRTITNYRGVSEKSRIYAVLEVEDYLGIAHTDGVDLYSSDRYERTLDYKQWIWSDYQFCEQFHCKNDYHNIAAKTPLEYITGLEMFQHTSRYYRKKIDYYSSSMDFLYETFGVIESEQISNELYPVFHFIQKIYTQKSIHSSSLENSTTVIRVKHNNVRRQKISNTTFMYSVNLNRQLQGFANSKENPLSPAEFQKNFGMYSLFFWDSNPVLYLSQKYNASKNKFIFKRRYCEQGIGKTFTSYFNNSLKHKISSNLLTLSSVASVSLMQICSTKDFQLADQMVNIVQNFTIKNNQQQQNNSIKLNVAMLSQLSLSQNHNILKSCINILMSTALTQQVSLHPLYQYFILNAKYLEETKQKIITDTETVWFVYLGIGFIYSAEIFDQDQVKILIMRLIESIDVVNFQERPDLTLILLKVFNQGVRKWKKLISANIAMKIFIDLFKIFFLYDGISFVPADDKKFNFCFEKLSTNQIRKMKQQITKTIIYLSKEFNNQFLQVLRIQALNQKPHAAYPSSVIEILRQYIKSEKPEKNLVFYIELLLQCLSPMTPNLRKYVQKNILQTLQLMCSYENISFNHASQKLSLKTQNNIYIYCLRTSTKWRTISLKQKIEGKQRKSQNLIEEEKVIPKKQNQVSLLQMSPKGTYIALLSNRKLKIWRLSSGFWSGVLGAFSQGWSFDVEGISLKWDDKEESITVINENPSENKCFKL